MPRSARISTSSRSCSVSSSSLRLVKTPAMLPESSRDERASPSLMRWNQERLGAGSGAFCGSAFCSTFLVTVTLPGAGFGSGAGCGTGCSSGAISARIGCGSTGAGWRTGGWISAGGAELVPPLRLQRDGAAAGELASASPRHRGEGAGRRMRGRAELLKMAAQKTESMVVSRPVWASPPGPLAGGVGTSTGAGSGCLSGRDGTISGSVGAGGGTS